MTHKRVRNKHVTLAEAKAHISSLISEGESGAEITITRHGKPVARLIGAPTQAVRTPGDWKWAGSLDPAVFAPLTDQEMVDEGWPV